jgi:hypothetical protein
MNANVLPRYGLIGSATQGMPDEARVAGQVHGWNPDDFAREQIRGLVQRVFFSNNGEWVKQVVFSAAELTTDLGDICVQVGQALALETTGEVAIVTRSLAEDMPRTEGQRHLGGSAIKAVSTQLATNLWSVPESGLHELCPEPARGRCWLWALAELRNDFEYAVIQGPGAGVWSESGFLGQLADGIILVLEAHGTRRVTARKIKEMLEGTRSRILGTILSQRTFPVPEKLYQLL